MNVPPSESENTRCPIDAIITAGVRSAQRNLRMNHRTPSPAPGSVSDRTVRISRITNRPGMMMVLARSIPWRSPLIITSAQASITAAVHASCRTNDFTTKPRSGGRMAAASSGTPTACAACPSA